MNINCESSHRKNQDGGYTRIHCQPRKWTHIDNLKEHRWLALEHRTMGISKDVDCQCFTSSSEFL